MDKCVRNKLKTIKDHILVAGYFSLMRFRKFCGLLIHLASIMLLYL